MRFTVVWRETALQQLARVWLEATDREAVNQEVDQIDLELRDDPDQKGDDYYGDRYLLLPIMWALYTVRPDDRTATVLQIGRTGIELPHENLPPVDE